MNIKFVLLVGLLGVLMFGGVNTEETLRRTSQREPRKLDVIQPLITMKKSYEKFSTKFDLLNIIKLLFYVVEGCLMPILQPSPTKSAPRGPSSPDLKSRLTETEVQLITDKLSYVQSLPNFGIEIEQADNSCESAAFKNIHDFVWKEKRQQLPDLVNFLYRFGYDGIYDDIIESYEAANCPSELIEDIENAKPGQGKISQVFNGYNSSSNVREQLLQEGNSPSQEPQCNILEIISRLPDTGLLDLGSFIQTVIYEFNNSPDLHFLIGKLQEPIKGKSVREFHLLPEVQGLIKIAHQKLIQSPVWKDLFIVIRQLTGIDLININIIEFLFSLFEYLVWGTVYPLP